jgi:hypothetical protein
MELQLFLLTSLRFVDIDVYDWGYSPHPELISGPTSILKRKLVSIETISISLQLFGRPENILEAEVRAG